MAKEWFRRSTWTEQDREEFNARLKRSRGDFHKAQYLRIQAVHLAEAGLHAAAIELLDRLLVEFPGDSTQLATAHLQKAKALASLAKSDEVVEEFRAAVQAERDKPNIKTRASTHYAWFVLEHQRANLYDEALQLLTEFRDTQDPTFPVILYAYFAAMAVLTAHKGDTERARDFARRAILEAERTDSGFRHHRKLGLVGAQPAWMEAKLRELAGS